jgi:hypothetical protein
LRRRNSAINELSGSGMVSTGILPPLPETGNKSFVAHPKFRSRRGDEAHAEKRKAGKILDSCCQDAMIEGTFA